MRFGNGYISLQPRIEPSVEGDLKRRRSESVGTRPSTNTVSGTKTSCADRAGVWDKTNQRVIRSNAAVCRNGGIGRSGRVLQSSKIFAKTVFIDSFHVCQIERCVTSVLDIKERSTGEKESNGIRNDGSVSNREMTEDRASLGMRAWTYSFRQLSNDCDGLIVVVDLYDRSIEFEERFIETMDALGDSFKQ